MHPEECQKILIEANKIKLLFVHQNISSKLIIRLDHFETFNSFICKMDENSTCSP